MKKIIRVNVLGEKDNYYTFKRFADTVHILTKLSTLVTKRLPSLTNVKGGGLILSPERAKNRIAMGEAHQQITQWHKALKG